MKRFEDDYRSDPRRRAETRDERRPEPREDRHRGDRVEARDRRPVIDDRMDIRDSNRAEPRERLDTVMDTRMPSSRIEPARPNAGARLQERGVDRYGTEVRAEVYKDPRTGELRDARTGALYQPEVTRTPRGFDDRMDRDDPMDRDDIPSNNRRTREIVDLAPARGYDDDDYRGSAKYNDYFVPGTGIDREVIQHEICRYLGNDATVRPFTNKDGRPGFVVRAYRALTSAMIEDLKKDSQRWRQEQDKRQRSGRGAGSYADMKGREEASYRDVMDVDMMDDYDRVPRNRHDLDPRQSASRHAVAPVSTGYASEPGYYVSSNPPTNFGPETLPRTHQESYRNPGGSTPPTSRAQQPGYSQPTYPQRTSATAPPVPVSAYRDPRTGQLISSYEPSYPAEPRRRHG